MVFVFWYFVVVFLQKDINVMALVFEMRPWCFDSHRQGPRTASRPGLPSLQDLAAARFEDLQRPKGMFRETDGCWGMVTLYIIYLQQKRRTQSPQSDVVCIMSFQRNSFLCRLVGETPER